MYKNMTRKGLALGAGLALVASALVATPAQAVATGSLWSNYGPTNNLVGVLGTDFELRFGAQGTVTSAAGLGADAAGITAQAEDLLANHIIVTPVPKAGQSTSVAIMDVTATSVGALNPTNATDGTVTIEVSSGGTLTGNTAFTTQSVVAIGAPSNLTSSLSVDVTIVYDDGSQSETERVTFLPKTSVSASITLGALAISGSAARAAGNTVSFSGINTGNFVSSNFSFTNGATPSATQFGVLVTNGTAKTASAFNYDVVTDTYGFTFTDEIVAADVITAQLYSNSADANLYFDATSTTLAKATFTVGAADAYDDMDISIGANTGIAHNSTATDTALVTAETVVAKSGTKSLNFTIQAYSAVATLTAAGSGIPISVTLTDTANGLGTTTITSGTQSLDVSGSAISFTTNTNSAGQIAFTVTADKAVDGESFTIDARGPLATVLDTTTVKFQDASFTLLPATDGNFEVAPGGTLAVDYTVVDQFGNLADATYQVAVTRAPTATTPGRDTAAEYANWSYVAPVSATGRASLTIVDNGAAATEGVDTVTVALQKAATAGSGYIGVAASTSDTFTITYENDLAAMTATALTNNDGIANAAGLALAPLKLETVALVDYDSRLGGAKPAYATDGSGTKGNVANSAVGAAVPTYTGTGMLRVYGQVKTAANSGISGVAVKLSATGANFANASAEGSATLMLNDSIVVFTDATGSYEAWVRSGKAGTQTISIDAQGATSSATVRFQSSTGVATGLTLTGPTSVASGARADFIATVVDKYGKAVSGVDVTFKDNGPGVLNTTAAVSTDAFGESMATLTTLAAEKGTTVVTAYATIGGVLVTQTATITVGAASAATDTVVNVGSFNGKLVVYANKAAGAKISYKIAGKWVVQNPTSDTLQRYDRVVAAKGVTVMVDIYVDGVKKLSKSVVTK